MLSGIALALCLLADARMAVYALVLAGLYALITRAQLKRRAWLTLIGLLLLVGVVALALSAAAYWLLALTLWHGMVRETLAARSGHVVPGCGVPHRHADRRSQRRGGTYDVRRPGGGGVGCSRREVDVAHTTPPDDLVHRCDRRRRHRRIRNEYSAVHFALSTSRLHVVTRPGTGVVLGVVRAGRAGGLRRARLN